MVAAIGGIGAEILNLVAKLGEPPRYDRRGAHLKPARLCVLMKISAKMSQVCHHKDKGKFMTLSSEETDVKPARQ